MSKNAAEDDQWVVVGKIVSAYGVKGWLKIRSFTQNEDDLFRYKPWVLKSQVSTGAPSSEGQEVSLEQYRKHGKGYVAHIDGCDDRNKAELLRGLEIAVKKETLPKADPDEVYWSDLEGLRVVNLEGETLGIVDILMETGANDVLSVKPCDSSIDDQKRLIPYVDHIINEVNLDDGLLIIDWNAEY